MRGQLSYGYAGVMTDPNQRDAKLIQYMQEAYGKEQELELALQADILLTTKDPYKKRLKQHLKETKAHSKSLERRIKKLGGGGTTVQKLVDLDQLTGVSPRVEMILCPYQDSTDLRTNKRLRPFDPELRASEPALDSEQLAPVLVNLVF